MKPEGGTPPQFEGPGSDPARLRKLTAPEGADEEQQGQHAGQQQVPRQQLLSEENHGGAAAPAPRPRAPAVTALKHTSAFDLRPQRYLSVCHGGMPTLRFPTEIKRSRAGQLSQPGSGGSPLS